MEANVYEKPLNLVHMTEHGMTIVSSADSMMVVGVLCARAHWPEIVLSKSGPNMHLLILANAWVALGDDDAAQVQYHIDTYAPQQP